MVAVVMVMVEENQLVAVLGIIINIYQEAYSVLDNVATPLEITNVTYRVFQKELHNLESICRFIQRTCTVF
jgi:hypothetical protein